MAAFAGAAVAVQTGPGRRAEDAVYEAVADTARRVRVNLLPGAVGFVLDLFRRLAGGIERGLYAVEDWLRVRGRRAGPVVALKAVLAAAWSPVAYVVRFAFNLLIEPQINPVKHFPVVTVSHKLLLPLIPAFAAATGLDIEAATLVIGAIPGVFGFVVWELKEDWRLYAANRPDVLTPTVIGRHGETVRAFLRPGFHSGTVPRVFRRARGAVEAAVRANRVRPPGPAVELAELTAEVRQFIDTEFVAYLRLAPAWRALAPRVVSVRLGVESVRATVAAAGHADPVGVEFWHAAGAVRAAHAVPAWVNHLPGGDQKVLAAALAGLAAAAGVTGAPAVPWADWAADWDAARGQADPPAALARAWAGSGFLAGTFVG